MRQRFNLSDYDWVPETLRDLVIAWDPVLVRALELMTSRADRRFTLREFQGAVQLAMALEVVDHFTIDNDCFDDYELKDNNILAHIAISLRSVVMTWLIDYPGFDNPDEQPVVELLFQLWRDLTVIYYLFTQQEQFPTYEEITPQKTIVFDIGFGPTVRLSTLWTIHRLFLLRYPHLFTSRNV